MKILLRCFSKENIQALMCQIFKGRSLKIQLILLFIFLGFSASFAQEITLKKERGSLDIILTEVGNQTGYAFFYKKEDINTVKKITVNLKSASLRQALNKILEGTDLQYEIFDKTIVVKKKQAAETGGDKNQVDVGSIPKPKRLIKGRVYDEHNLPLGQVSVQELVSKVRTISNAKGEFELLSPSSGSLSFTGKKINEQIVDYNDTTTFVDVKLEIQSIALNEVSVNIDAKKLEPGRFVEMKNRNYMNLSQILQGTVPGLSLQIVNTTSKTVTSIDAFIYFRNGQVVNTVVRMSVEEYLNYEGRAKGQANIDLLLSGKNVPRILSDRVHLNTTSTTRSSLVPQIRGGNSFSSNTANMLVVIDGFPQDGFPADYPMINVESIEVIKDQKELIKWGSRASGGVILVKTKAAKKGNIQVNYTTNLYYTPAQKFSREKLQLASPAAYIDLLQDVDRIVNVGYNNAALNFSPARRLIAQKRNGLISTDVFNKSLDSLKGLDNESQMQLLQQDKFSQSHALGLNGGGNNYKFNSMTNYSSEKTSDLNGYNKTLTFSLNNDINLLKNKLKINWLINYSNSTARAGYNFSPNLGLEPYQMLLDDQGNYVNDYSAFSPYANATIKSLGYKDHGVNILQDATVNRNLSRGIEKKTNFNARWELLPGLNWATSLYYVGTNRKTSTLYGKESSYVRQMVNNYGEYSPTGINFYVPYGDILQANNRKLEEVNLRSGLVYTRNFGKHEVSAAVGGGVASISSSAPTTPTIYGYNSEDNTSSQVFLPAPNPLASIRNFYSVLPEGTSSVNPYILTVPINGDTTLSRNVNSNASLTYRYSDRITVSGIYTGVYTPLYGATAASYSTSSNYKGDITGLLFKNVGRFVKNISLSTGVESSKLPDLPSTYSNTRYQQTTWQNYTIWVNGAQPTQQNGQSSRTIYQRLTFGLLDSTLTVNGAFNTQKRMGSLINLSSDPAKRLVNGDTTIRYFSAGLKGRMRKGLLNFQVDYNKSPEGKSQVNGYGNYDIGHEDYLNSNTISALNVGFKIENVSSFQGLALMMGTNVTTSGSYGLATNSDFSQLPPRNTSYELSGQIGLNDDAQTFDLRYYRQSSSGLNNFAPVATDPASGYSSRVTYSTITNKGLEFFFKTRVIKTNNFEYSVTLNGAYNVNIADEVPLTAYTGADNYSTAYREGYDITNVWSVRSAPLNNEGNPQIYDANGNITSTLDSATVVGSMVYSGVTRAPWTGGLIQEINYKHFFLRAALNFNLGHVMRTYIPYLSTTTETSALIAQRWRNPGDEAFTIVPKITSDFGNTYRSYITRMGTNSIVSADNIRFQELMIGCNLPASMLKKWGLNAVTIAFQAQNLAIWTKNSLHIDPATISGSGKVGMPTAKQYSCNISVSF